MPYRNRDMGGLRGAILALILRRIVTSNPSIQPRSYAFRDNPPAEHRQPSLSQWCGHWVRAAGGIRQPRLSQPASSAG